MYPIDLLKVHNLFQSSYSHPDRSVADSDASRQPFAHRGLLRHIKCYGHNNTSRRFSHTMEGSFQRSLRSWWVFDFKASQDLGLMA